MTLRRRLPPATARQLQRDAGPPTRWAIAALIGGSLPLGVAVTQTGLLRLTFVVGWLAVLAIPSVVDSDGWRARIGMAWLAAEQRRRMDGLPRMPRTPAGADRWLRQPGAGDAGLAQASVLLIAGRTADARRLLEEHVIGDAEDRARVVRMLAAIDGLERGRVDPAEANRAIDELPPDARRYHRLSLAWSTAWVDAVYRRPWRPAFAEASRGIGTSGIPARFLVYAAFQQLLLPIAGIVAGLILRLAGLI